MVIHNIFFLLMGYGSIVSSHPRPTSVPTILSGRTAVPPLLSGRYEFFMDQPWFKREVDTFGGALGALPVEFAPVVNLYHQADTFVKDLMGGKMGGRSEVGPDSEGESQDEWPGRHDSVNLTNTGADVVTVFKENLKARLEKVSGAQSKATDVDSCKEECKGQVTEFEKGWCALECLVKEQEDLKSIIGELFQGILSYCNSMDTIYMKFNEYGIYSLDKFRMFLIRVDNPVIETNMNIPFRAQLTRLIRQVKTPVLPMREFLDQLNLQLENLKAKTNAEDRILVNENPGCAQIPLAWAISYAIDMIAKNPALTDYLVFQGYALADALTKYVDDFPIKKNFAVQIFGYDVMIGTTCGLYLYGSKSETTDCDQYGGFPVIDMPAPVYMWDEEDHKNCLFIKDQLARPRGDGASAPNAKKKRQLGGDGKSLKVLRKR